VQSQGFSFVLYIIAGAASIIAFIAILKLFSISMTLDEIRDLLKANLPHEKDGIEYPHENKAEISPPDE
jgi:hypothetical protein